MSKLARTIPVAVLASTALMASASQAGAAVTIGQLAPSSPPIGCAVGPSDFAQAAVSSGNGYVVPPLSPPIAQVVTSWSHNARASNGGQTLKMKIWRQVTGLTYLVVGSDGPRPLTSGEVNTFQTSIPVQPGDVLGINSQNAAAVPNACLFSAPGDPGPLGNFGDQPDGAQTTFVTNVNDFRVNATALVEPDCDNDGLGDQTQDANLSTCAAGTTPTGPVLGPTGTPVFCKGKPATIVGTRGSDVRVGSRGRDVIVGLGGNDRLSGVGGNDLICGGKGKDTLIGGKGKDKLYGQKGKDTLRGKAGKDLCVGGPGKDKAKACEKEKKI